MAVSNFDIQSLTFKGSVYNAEKELNELKSNKISVKEVVDSGITQVPNIFIYPKQHQQYDEQASVINDGHKQVPVIDLQGLRGERRSEIVSQIRRASETWGMFQLINHGVSQIIIESMLESMKGFNDQPKEFKSEFQTVDATNKKVLFRQSIHPLYKFVMWKDSLKCQFEDLSTAEIQGLPFICRKPVSDYMRCVTELKDELSELLTEALGLRSDYLKMIECMEASHLVNHYSPACPEPALAMATTEHADPYFLTLLVQNHIDALQVLYENQWIDVNIKKGAIVANIGDMLQIISNDIFKSAEHRVLARSTGPRLSSVCFFHPTAKLKSRIYGPVKELLDGVTAPVFRETSLSNYLEHFMQSGITGQKCLSIFRI